MVVKTAFHVSGGTLEKMKSNQNLLLRTLKNLSDFVYNNAFYVPEEHFGLKKKRENLYIYLFAYFERKSSYFVIMFTQTWQITGENGLHTEGEISHS